MATALTIDDFKPFNLTCELRYKNAYFVFDRTGLVIEDLRDSFTDIKITAAAPQQSSFTAHEGTFGLEIGACRFTSGRPDKTGETFAAHCKTFFDVVAQRFGIRVFTRVGIRFILRREFKTEEESQAALAAMMLVNLKPAKRFNASEGPTEVFLRWEDSQIGAFVRLRAEKADYKLDVPAELQDIAPKFEKTVIGLTLDTDYYTVAPVEVEQWNVKEWLPQRLRIIRREVDGILAGGK